jgi:RND superfamily putative drug exporter
MLARIARSVARRPWAVLLIWVGIATALAMTTPRLREVATQDNSAFLANDAPSVVGAIALARIWPEDDIGNTGALVFRRDAGVTSQDEAFIRAEESWLRSAQAPDGIRGTQSPYTRPELTSVLRSQDGKVVILVIQFRYPPFTPETDEAVTAIRTHADDGAPEGLETHLTGNAGVGSDQSNAIDEAVRRTTLITILLVSAILLWVYRSPVTPLVPLVTVGVALVVSQGIVALLAEAGLKVSTIVETFMVVIVFGAGTDYCLFIVSRYKEELARQREAKDQDRRVLVGSMAIIGAVIASSAATVVVGFSSQGVAEFGLYRTTGPAMAIAVLITVTAGLTLVPAFLAVLGRWAFWPWRAVREPTVPPATKVRPRRKAAA